MTIIRGERVVSIDKSAVCLISKHAMSYTRSP